MKQTRIAILMGSDSDLPAMKPALDTLEKLGVAFSVDVMSAHRTPDAVAEFAGEAAGQGIQVIIAGAGGAAHLAGVIAAHTTLPVIGVPIDSSPLDGVDALYATVQMPPGVPVATVAVNGSCNAALLAVQILATADPDLADALVSYKAEMARKVAGKAEKLRKRLKES